MNKQISEMTEQERMIGKTAANNQTSIGQCAQPSGLNFYVSKDRTQKAIDVVKMLMDKKMFTSDNGNTMSIESVLVLVEEIARLI